MGGCVPRSMNPPSDLPTVIIDMLLFWESEMAYYILEDICNQLQKWCSSWCSKCLSLFGIDLDDPIFPPCSIQFFVLFCGASIGYFISKLDFCLNIHQYASATTLSLSFSFSFLILAGSIIQTSLFMSTAIFTLKLNALFRVISVNCNWLFAFVLNNVEWRDRILVLDPFSGDLRLCLSWWWWKCFAACNICYIFVGDELSTHVLYKA